MQFIIVNTMNVKIVIFTKNNLDTRTKDEYFDTPCYENIHDYLERNDSNELPE